MLTGTEARDASMATRTAECADLMSRIKRDWANASPRCSRERWRRSLEDEHRCIRPHAVQRAPPGVTGSLGGGAMTSASSRTPRAYHKASFPTTHTPTALPRCTLTDHSPLTLCGHARRDAHAASAPPHPPPPIGRRDRRRRLLHRPYYDDRRGWEVLNRTAKLMQYRPPDRHYSIFILQAVGLLSPSRHTHKTYARAWGYRYYGEAFEFIRDGQGQLTDPRRWMNKVRALQRWLKNELQRPTGAEWMV